MTYVFFQIKKNIKKLFKMVFKIIPSKVYFLWVIVSHIVFYNLSTHFSEPLNAHYNQLPAEEGGAGLPGGRDGVGEGPG